MTLAAQPLPVVRLVDLTIDGRAVKVPEGSTILDACRAQGIDTPTMCYADNLTPVNACRVCMVEVEGSRVLVPSCSRRVEEGMEVRTDTERVRHSRKLVMEFLDSSVDTDRSRSLLRGNQDFVVTGFTDVEHDELCTKLLGEAGGRVLGPGRGLRPIRSDQDPAVHAQNGFRTIR